MSKIKFCSLGGLDEVGKNCYILDINGKFLIFDLGHKTPDILKLNNEIIIPDISFLEINRHKILGIFLSSTSDEKIGAIPYVAKKLNVPIFCSKFVKDNLKRRFLKINEPFYSNIRTFKSNTSIKFDDIEVFILRAPGESLSNFIFAINFDNSLIWYATEFIFDSKLGEHNYSFINSINQLSNKYNSSILIQDSSSANISEHASPKHRFSPYFNKFINDNLNSRIIISIFENDMFHTKEIIDIAKKINKKLFIYSKTLNENLKNAFLSEIFEEDYSNDSYSDINSNENCIILVAGNEETLFNKLLKIGLNTDNILKITNEDVFINAAFAKSFNEVRAYQAITEISKNDAKMLSIPKRLIKKMTPNTEDIRMMINLTKPKFIIPISAFYKDMLKTKKICFEENYTSKCVPLLENGEVISFTDNNIEKTKELVKHDSIFMSGSKIDNIKIDIINERIELGKNGITIISFSWNTQTKSISSIIDIQMKGLIFVQKEDERLKDIREIVNEEFNQRKSNNLNIAHIKDVLSNKVEKYFIRNMNKYPKVLINITIH